MTHEARERPFDELARGLAAGTVSRRKALRLMGAALVGGALASFPGAAWAAKGGNSACAKYCKTLFGGDTAAQEECTAQGTRGTGPCFACGGTGNPAPTCGTNEVLNPETCRCQAGTCLVGTFECDYCENPYTGRQPCFCYATADGTGTVCGDIGGRSFSASSCDECTRAIGSVCVRNPNPEGSGYEFACTYPCFNGTTFCL
jgi:hypothetical protein